MTSIVEFNSSMGGKLTSVAIDEKSITKLNSEPRDICYQHVINYPRSSVKGQHTCVMCGKMDSKDCVIPGQNKDVCKVCDSLVWLSDCQDLEFKFCKGCKNFVCISEFCDKPKASKCGKCRNRCRSSYSARRSSSGSSDSYELEFSKYRISGSPRGVADFGSRDSDEFQTDRKTPATLSDGIFSAQLSKTKSQDMARYYSFDPASAYMSPSIFGSGMVSPLVADKESAVGSSKHQRPRIGGVVGEQGQEPHVDSSVLKTPRSSTTPGLLLPRIPNSLLNIHSTSKRPAADVESTPAPSSATGKSVLDDLLLLNTSLRKSPLTFISGVPSPEIGGDFTGFGGSEDFSPSQHRRMFLEQRMGFTPRPPSTPSQPSRLPTPTSTRSWDSQEGGAWYHDVLLAMSKDQSVKKPAIARSRSMDDSYDPPVAKRIRYGEAPSPDANSAKNVDMSPPSTPWVPITAASAVRGAATCPAPRQANFSHVQTNSAVKSASCSKAQAKWEWDPNANPLMHLAMVLSKNENDEEEIFRDLSSDSGSSDGGSDNGSVRSLANSPHEITSRSSSIPERISSI